MRRNDRDRLEDALEAVRAAISFGADFTPDALAADARTLAAIKYELLILGEAVGGLSPVLLSRAPDLPWAQMRALRNVIAHEYFRVDVGVLHQVVTADLPALLPKFTRLLMELAEEP